MQGETDLTALLRGLSPVLDNQQYTFVSVADKQALLPVIDDVRGLFVEKEGVTLIVPLAVAAREGWQSAGVFNCITCNVHSSLDAVGMTAAISAALTEAGISANVVAAYYHDHLFVPVQQADAALSALATLSAS
ncbi:ACT domain-containing protein [Alteromonas halophila]|uniref:Transporter n=1 Tax=Alteromonas halophila TaxID=516698 RepID=A0A918MYH6_9ALTE|nr:ACT domain-containing protein [Alteromonas halophila]GGW83335.1 transporter [Alteromonas halophila]